ncbi:MAG: glutathione S-transferase family protein [Alphaproteobacteria bacterium]|nr:glutathione S-transferase family protein [Alphaproteobacteria bacterium]
MSLKLYHHDASTCSQKVRICLAEKGVKWIGHHVDLTHGENLEADFLAINPNGVVPAFVHDGTPIIESTVMCEYVDEVWTDGAGLTPEDPKKRAEMRAWLRYIDEVPSMAVRVPTFQNLLIDRFKAMSEDEYAEFRDSNTLRRDFFMRLNRTGFSDEEYENSLLQLRATIERMEAALAQNGPWIIGVQFTIADICMAPLFQRMEDLGMSNIWDDAHHVAEWFDGVKARPSYDVAFYPGSRITDLFPQLRKTAQD